MNEAGHPVEEDLHPIEEAVYDIFNQLSSGLASAETYFWGAFAETDESHDDPQSTSTNLGEKALTNPSMASSGTRGAATDPGPKCVLDPVPLEKALANPKNAVDLTVKSLSGETVLEMTLPVSTPVWRINSCLRGRTGDDTPMACQRLVNVHGDVLLDDRKDEQPQTLLDVLGFSNDRHDQDSANVTMSDNREMAAAGVRKGFLYYIRAASQRAASGSLAGDLRFWDLETGEELGALVGREGNVDTIAIAIDWFNLKAVSGADDGEVIVWDIARGERSLELIGHTDTVWAVAACFDGAHANPSLAVPCALSGSAAGDLRLWDLNKVCLVWDARPKDVGEVGGILSVAADWQGSRALTGCEDGSIRLWLLESGCCVGKFTGHHGAIWSVHADWQGERFLSGSADADLRLWDLDLQAREDSEEQSMATLSGHESCIWAVSACWGSTPQGLSGSSDCDLRLWDLAQGTCIAVVGSHALAVLSVAVDWDRMRAVSGSADHVLYVWDLRKQGSPVHSLTGHKGEIRDVAIGVALT
eukprot:gnl/MRDRNA2_/MRDRNA2_82818_c0_seq1.p1 gnl/MRDRNA2_/MRDRNA2_82818_c0~~gnl/MRDRNA2_/MRDRNA2_82818_c0_seq1.p1  ORF type:complete len:530 (-),score=94.10 gnl/MRDRNA2_/MRDRNA2_82818_c0_seq1:49-1638(-)